jgi:hypothetical protein
MSSIKHIQITKIKDCIAKLYFSEIEATLIYLILNTELLNEVDIRDLFAI